MKENYAPHELKVLLVDDTVLGPPNPGLNGLRTGPSWAGPGSFRGVVVLWLRRKSQTGVYGGVRMMWCFSGQSNVVYCSGNSLFGSRQTSMAQILPYHVYVFLFPALMKGTAQTSRADDQQKRERVRTATAISYQILDAPIEISPSEVGHVRPCLWSYRELVMECGRHGVVTKKEAITCMSRRSEKQTSAEKIHDVVSRT